MAITVFTDKKSKNNLLPDIDKWMAYEIYFFGSNQNEQLHLPSILDTLFLR